MGNPTNPNRVVRVKDLNRFKGNTDGLYATKTVINTKADKSNTYTKTEVDTKLNELKGPTYNPLTRTISYPTTSAVTYDAANRKIVIPTVSV